MWPDVWNNFCSGWGIFGAGMILWPLLWFGFWVFILTLIGYFFYKLFSRDKKTEQKEYLVSPTIQRKCPGCGSRVEEVYLCCPSCGYKLKENCPSCSKVIKIEWQVCPYCLAALS